MKSFFFYAEQLLPMSQTIVQGCSHWHEVKLQVISQLDVRFCRYVWIGLLERTNAPMPGLTPNQLKCKICNGTNCLKSFWVFTNQNKISSFSILE
jgi:hypothetical protein